MGYGSSSSNVTLIDLSGVPFEVLSITVSLISRIIFEYGYHYKVLRSTAGETVNNDAPILLARELPEIASQRISDGILRREWLLPGEGEQALDQLYAAARRLQRRFDEFANCRVVRALILQGGKIADDDRQQIIEVVCESTGQLPNGSRIANTRSRSVITSIFQLTVGVRSSPDFYTSYIYSLSLKRSPLSNSQYPLADRKNPDSPGKAPQQPGSESAPRLRVV